MTQSKQSFLDDSTQISDELSDGNKSIYEQEFKEQIQQTRRGITIEHPKSYEYVWQILTQFVHINNQNLDQETKDKVTNTIAKKDSN